MQIQLKSFAKINLSLDVTGLTDHYLCMTTVMQSISLCDLIDIQISEGNGVHLSYKNMALMYDAPPTYQAIVNFCQSYSVQHHLDITVHKNIPIKSGLGGGSSNLASIISALNKLCPNPLRHDELVKFCHHYSKDSPFFFTGGTALVKQPEIFVQKLPCLIENTYIVLIYVQPGLSTQEVCQRYRDVTGLSDTFYCRKWLDACPSFECGNALVQAALDLMPQLSDIAQHAHLSGTGSTFFQIHHSLEMAEKSMNIWQRNLMCQCFLVRPLCH